MTGDYVGHWIEDRGEVAWLDNEEGIRAKKNHLEHRDDVGLRADKISPYQKIKYFAPEGTETDESSSESDVETDESDIEDESSSESDVETDSSDIDTDE